VGRKSRQVIQAELNEIRRLSAERKQDSEIAAVLGITPRGLSKLKARIY
jgi:DNA-binding CsgD family transcriptional regulator